MTARCLNLIAAFVVATFSASGQNVDRILVTQAGLVPDGPFTPVMAARDTPNAASPDRTGAAGFAAEDPAAFPNPVPVPDEKSWEVDQNLIPRAASQVMSRYVVRDLRAPEFRLRDLYTRQGLVHLTFREHPGLFLGNFFNRNDDEAYNMFLEEERLQNIQNFKDTAHAIAVGGDMAEAKAIDKAADETFIRDEYSVDPAGGVADAPQPRAETLMLSLEEARLTLVVAHF